MFYLMDGKYFSLHSVPEASTKIVLCLLEKRCLDRQILLYFYFVYHQYTSLRLADKKIHQWDTPGD